MNITKRLVRVIPYDSLSLSHPTNMHWYAFWMDFSPMQNAMKIYGVFTNNLCSNPIISLYAALTVVTIFQIEHKILCFVCGFRRSMCTSAFLWRLIVVKWTSKTVRGGYAVLAGMSAAAHNIICTLSTKSISLGLM